ncbi:MAG: NTP transferase domain-containing protein [Sterolibacteriaceae bacterium]|jgi:D-glycero-alpha-D-manno-heptose 1-phosphate guanylyltransferase|nr:NTP transferase domain-containing protein [Sterolibacteriaceae bacterium]
MEAIVLAGGLGTRLRDVVSDIPKPMAPVAGRPFLEILLANLARKGFGRVILSIGHLAQAITRHFGDAFEGMALSYEIEPIPLGTGGAARAALARCDEDHAFVFNGDTFLDLELAEVEALWRKTRAPIVVARHVADTTRYGRLDVRDGLVLLFREKGIPGSGLINAGSYLMPRDALAHFARGTPFSLETDYLIPAVRDTRVHAFVTHGFFIDIGLPEDFRRAQAIFAGSSE